MLLDMAGIRRSPMRPNLFHGNQFYDDAFTALFNAAHVVHGIDFDRVMKIKNFFDKHFSEKARTISK